MSIFGSPISFIATAKSDQCRYFYETLLSLTCVADDPFAMEFDLGQSSLRIQKVESIPDCNHTVLGWQVKDIRRCVEDFSARGIQFEKFTQLAQDESGIWQSPGGALVAWFKDPDGNTLSLTELEATSV